MPQLSIIIVTYNRADLLDKCLDSLERYLKNSDCEIIVVDNASTDNTESLIRSKHGTCIYLRNQTNLFFAKANNIGYSVAKGKYILLLNNDIELVDSSTCKLVNVLEDNEAYAAACGRLLNFDGTQQIGFNFRRLPTYWTTIGELFLIYRIPVLKRLLNNHYCLNVDYDRVQIVEQAAASMFLIRKSVIDRIGLFNESLFYYYNDVDFCHRLKINDCKIVYLPQVKALHHQNASQELIPSANWVNYYYSNLLQYSKMYFTPFQHILLRYLVVASLFFKLFILLIAKILFPFDSVKMHALGKFRSFADLMNSSKQIIKTVFSEDLGSLPG